MLSAKTIELIKSTVPVLEVHGVSITKRFYERMFSQHPELLHIFNHANQKQGRQQTALANAVYAAAKYIDNLGAILPVVKQIAHKHRSLGVKPEHYPIVGENLLAAIKDVLGDAATDEIVGAWAEAYGVIADVFISVEAEMYEQAREQVGGWEDFRPFVVEKKVQESDVITSFYLVPQDGQPLSAFEPGQYISVKIDLPGERFTHIRQYSLSDAPGKPYYRISVKREDALADKPAGKVSVYLHEHVKEGDVLQLSAPAGDFTLDQSDRPVVLISGGVGLTPMVSMLHTLAEKTNRQVTFIHGAQDGNRHALRKEVEKVVSEHPNVSAHWCYSQPTEQDREAGAFDKEGFIDLAWLQSIVPVKEASYYFCGPVPFMSAIKQALTKWGIPAEDIHYEFFGPAGSL
ncbi:NO-inducible flavohemoprotein [Brevibacillus sp. GCM10020057]|uniref:NO-inducible flavohemoprotein n=1 Tax=Brevibacillus sp. GCM10020057 TaxID=3317327 RepID=UPI003627A9BA